MWPRTARTPGTKTWREWFIGGARGRDESDAASVSPASHPAAEAQLRFLLEYGGLAPATGAHGAPPWLMRLKARPECAIDVVLAHRCAHDVYAPAHRGVMIACGAAIAQLRLSVRQLGFHESLVVLPDAAHRALVARVHLDDAGPANPEAYMLYQAMRAPIAVDEARAMGGLSDALLAEIRAVCEQERVRLHYVDRSILAASERVHAVDAAAMCDVPEAGEALALLHPFHVETFRPETDTWTTGQEPALGNAVGALVTTEHDGPPDWIAAGQALSRALLRARVDGVSAVVQGLTSRSIRAELTAGLHGEHPQVIVRFGYPRVGKLVRHETRMFEAVARRP